MVSWRDFSKDYQLYKVLKWCLRTLKDNFRCLHVPSFKMVSASYEGQFQMSLLIEHMS